MQSMGEESEWILIEYLCQVRKDSVPYPVDTDCLETDYRWGYDYVRLFITLELNEWRMDVEKGNGCPYRFRDLRNSKKILGLTKTKLFMNLKASMRSPRNILHRRKPARTNPTHS